MAEFFVSSADETTWTEMANPENPGGVAGTPDIGIEESQQVPAPVGTGWFWNGKHLRGDL